MIFSKLHKNNLENKKMKKGFLKYCFISFFISIFFSFVLFPYIIQFKIIKNLISSNNSLLFIGLISIIISLLIIICEKMIKLSYRYTNTHKLGKYIFTIMDGIILFLIFSHIFGYIFLKIDKTELLISHKFKVFIISLYFILLFYLILILIIMSNRYFDRKNKSKPINDSKKQNLDIFTLNDDPINFQEQDIFFRKEFVEDLFCTIKEMNINSSVVFGIYGKWGEGKTSILNLLKNNIENSSKDYIIINYNPWQYKDEESILNSFFSEIENSINESYLLPNLKKLFLKYKNTICSGVEKIGFKVDFLFENESFEKVTKNIELNLSIINKTIVIFIDDIDRLVPKEMLLIFQLIRIIGRVKKIIFILFFDPVIVQNCLMDSFKIEKDFLNKIVQLPIRVPEIESETISNFLYLYLDGRIISYSAARIFKGDKKNIFNNLDKGFLKFKKESDIVCEDIKEENKALLKSYLEVSENNLFDKIDLVKEKSTDFWDEIKDLESEKMDLVFNTLRSAKVFLNNLFLTIPAIAKEVYLFDLFILKVIEIFYPFVYNDIYINKAYYVKAFSLDFSYIREGSKKIKDHIENLIKDNKDRDLIVYLLNLIFPDVENAFVYYINENKYKEISKDRISDKNNFEKYFLFKVSERYIPSAKIIEIIAQLNILKDDKIENYLNTLIENFKQEDRLDEFFSKLLIYSNKIQENTSDLIIKYIYNSSLEITKNDDIWYSYGYVNRLLFSLIDGKKYPAKIKEIIEIIINQTNDLLLPVMMIYNYDNNLSNIVSAINIDELIKLVNMRLEKYFILGKRNIFDEFTEEVRWCIILRNWSINFKINLNIYNEEDRSVNKKVNEYTLNILRTDYKNTVKFLSGFKEDIHSMFFNFNYYWDIEELKNIIENHKNSSYSSKNDIALFDEYLKYFQKKPKK